MIRKKRVPTQIKEKSEVVDRFLAREGPPLNRRELVTNRAGSHDVGAKSPRYYAEGLRKERNVRGARRGRGQKGEKTARESKALALSDDD